MKPTILFLILSFCFAGALPFEAEAGQVRKKDFRKFFGKYSGSVSGVYGISGTGVFDPQPVSYDVDIRVNSRRRVTVFSGTRRAHRLTLGKPTGNKRRIRLRGTYSGEFTNPNSGATEQVSGFRRYIIRRRGGGRNARLLMNVRDQMQEGNLSYSSLKGKLER